MSKVVTATEAREIAQRFIDRHFDNGAESPRVSIPANPDRDDDLRLFAFIARAERVEAAAREALEHRNGFAHDDAMRLLRVALTSEPSR